MSEQGGEAANEGREERGGKSREVGRHRYGSRGCNLLKAKIDLTEQPFVARRHDNQDHKRAMATRILTTAVATRATPPSPAVFVSVTVNPFLLQLRR